MTNEDFNQIKIIANKEICLTDSIDEVMSKSLKIPNLYQKYLDLYIKESSILHKQIIKLEQKHGERIEDLKLNSRLAYKNKEEMDLQIIRNQEFADLRLEKERQQTIVSYLQECLSNINRMSFSIKNYIEIKKYMAGMN